MADPIPATPFQKLAWDQDAPTLADVQSYTFKARVDGTAFVALTNVEIVPTVTPTVFMCSVAMPALTPGRHTIEIKATQVVGDNVILESAWSPPIEVFMFVAPLAPRNLRITMGETGATVPPMTGTT